jgi:hypothetical protein
VDFCWRIFFLKILAWVFFGGQLHEANPPPPRRAGCRLRARAGTRHPSNAAAAAMSSTRQTPLSREEDEVERVFSDMCRALRPRSLGGLKLTDRTFTPLSLDELGEAHLSTMLYDRYRLGLVANRHAAPLRVRLTPDDRHWLRIVMSARPASITHPDLPILAHYDYHPDRPPDPNLTCVGIEMPPPLVAKMRRFEARLEQEVHATWSECYVNQTPPRLVSAFESPFGGGDALIEAHAQRAGLTLPAYDPHEGHPSEGGRLRPGWSVLYAHVDATRVQRDHRVHSEGVGDLYYGAPAVHLDSLGAKGERRDEVRIGSLRDLKYGSAVVPTLRAALFIEQAPAKMADRLFNGPGPDVVTGLSVAIGRGRRMRELAEMVVRAAHAKRDAAAAAPEPPSVQLVWFLDEVVVYTNLTNDHASMMAGDLDCAERTIDQVERWSKKRRRDDEDEGQVSEAALDRLVGLAGEVASARLCTYTEADEARAKAVVDRCEAVVAAIDAPAGVLAPARARDFESLYDA